ncbi:MAG: PQQ-like beta-propeller repeat protein [Sedimentisphaerales bacterium]|nr:PQQ-like beta-propeller repeat protein [Sedimentisphaerales bacterium]
MKRQILIWITPALLIVIASVLLYLWFTDDTASWDIPQRLPGADNKPADLDSVAGQIKIEGTLQTFVAFADKIPPLPEKPDSWPWFRGLDYNAVCKQDTRLARTWPETGPPILWSVELGEGYAGPAIHDGAVYIIDYDRENQLDVIRCFSLDDGSEIWSYSYPVKIKRFHGMSRAIPTVTDNYIVAIGPKCHVTCLDPKTGAFKWMINMVAEYGSTVPLWYTAQCPVIDDGKVILAPAGKDVLMMAVDCETGNILWTCPNPDGWVMTHSSILPMTFAGQKFYVYCAGDDSRGGIIAVSAADGSPVWKYTDWKVRTNVPMPVLVETDKLFFCAGYGQYDLGCMMLQLIEDNGKIRPEMLYTHNTEIFSSMQQTPIFYNGYLYGVRMVDKQLICMDLDANQIWTSTSAVKFGHGPYAIADNLLFAMDDEGLLRIAQATHTGYVRLDEAQVLDGHESWAPLAFANGRLLVRDTTHMVCLDIAAR